jgi:hypothetical protein
MRARRVLAGAQIALVLGVAGVLVLGGSASAHTGDVRTSVSAEGTKKGPRIIVTYGLPYLETRGYEIQGSVTSRQSQCMDHRNIKIYSRDSGTVELVHKGLTDADGMFQYNFGKEPQDEYFVRVIRRSVEAFGHMHTCAPARSEPFSLYYLV